ncbi:MAG: ATPase, T2SS/T4P/T4SS family, partial [Pseudomonadales bacterium]|nr:ATPase, T2SS/T4P/T4SS family [Pseudomonadales bacterium]
MEEYNIGADDIGSSLESYYNVPYMKYDPTHLLPKTLFENIKSSYLRNNLWLPVDGDKQEAVILMSDPTDRQKIMEIQAIVNAESYVFRVGIAEHILQFMREESDDEAESGFDDVFTRLDEQVVVEVEDDPDESQNDEQSAASSAIIQLVNKIIIESNRLGASDVHIEPGKDRSAGIVRIRVDGVCRELLRVPAEHLVSLMARIKIISKLDIAERRLPQDGACKLKMKGRLIELRVATVPTVFG